MIFQWESASATQYLRELLSDETVSKIQKQANVSYMDLLSIGNGAIRPAGASYREELAQGIFKDNGNEALNEFLAPTLGYLVYQEQIIDFLYKFCGFTMGEADVVRRCVDEDTYITMSNGLCKKIKDIKPGDVVASYNQNTVVNSTVKNVFDNGNREVYEITLSHRYKLKATLDHKVLTQSGWKTIKELSPNDYIMTPSRLQNTNYGITPKVINIQSAGISHVYDLEIDRTHNYIANGLVVHNCFAKKYGTEDMIPIIKNGGYINEGRHYIKGFTQTMVEQYNVSKKEAEELIVDFIKVIEDASAYLFSKNHADPYSWVGYICGYLRYHYPLEFITTALNIFADKEEKTLAIVDYAKKQGIPIKPIKFRFSTAEYSFNKATNEIFKGISSIKFMNVAIADEIYQLKDNDYPAFSDLLYDLDEKTSLNSRQLKILIELDFFEEFGDTNKLLKMSEIYDRFKGKVQIRKDILDEYGIDENIVRRNSEKETDKMFSKPHTKEMLRDIEANLRIPHRSLTDRIAAQIEYLGYINIADTRYSRMLAVLSVDTKYAPKIKVHSLKNGTILELKIDRKTYNRNKLKEGDIIKVTRQIKKNKTKRLEDGTYKVIPDTKEIWLTEYKKVDNL